MGTKFSSVIGEEHLGKVTYFGYFPVIRNEKSIKLFPSDHALYYPMEIDSNKNLLHGTINFYNEVLLKNYKPDNYLPSDKIRNKNFINKKSNKALVVNLLDNCYGHSLIKLFNLYEAHQQFSSQYDIYAITHDSLVHFIPQDKINIIDLTIGFQEAQLCYDLSAPILDQLRKNYSMIDFLVTDTFKVHAEKKSLLNFFNFFPTIKNGSEKMNIVFYYRADFFRMWGGETQATRITKFFNYLRPFFPGVEFLVAGEKDKYVFPMEIIDKRVLTFNNETDFIYNEIFRNSIIVIGIHGSNMLMPSLLSQMTIHLTPPHKFKNLGDDIFNQETNSILSLLENIYITGNTTLMEDIRPYDIGFKAINFFIASIEKKYKHYIMQDINCSSLSQDAYIKMHYPNFNYAMANDFRRSTLKKIESSVWKKHRAFRFFSRVKKLFLP